MTPYITFAGYSGSGKTTLLLKVITYLKEKGYKIVGIYVDEGKSARAKLKNRKELLKLIEDAKEEKFDRVVL